MRKMNPAVKFVTLLVVTFILAYRFHPVLNLLVFGISMVLIFTSGAKLKMVLLWLMPVFLAAIGMFFTGYRFTTEGAMPVQSSDFLLSDSHMYNGVAQASRVLAYAGVGFLFSFTTDRVHMVKSFQAQFHVPQVFAYGLLAAWGIVPQMMLEYRRTKIAFRARGIQVMPFSPALLKPLLIKSIRWSEALSIAMESKGFSANQPRTDFSPVRVHVYDWVFAVVAIGFTAAIAVFL